MLTCVTPPAQAVGLVDVTVLNSEGFDTVTDGFLFGFVRSDVDADTEIDINDALFGLEYLFTFGPAPICPDAFDIQDDGDHDLQDSIHLLTFIFLQGPPPAPPYPAPGLDPTDDDPFGCI